MADVKISALPAATTPLDGTELAPIVQSGTTKRVTVANLTVGRALTASSLTLTTPLSASNGGTGQSSYATGDLLYASDATTLSKLADVATGNALISGGVGTAPSWGKVGLTTHVSGTLPVANGGTGITSFGTGVATALGNAVNGASGLLVTDANNNLGLGVTPSAWWSGSKAMQIGLGGFIQGRTSTSAAVEIGANQYINTSVQRTYIANGAASYYEQTGGAHQWFTAASGAAGTAISFTQAMTLDASGQLQVGTTSAISTNASAALVSILGANKTNSNEVGILTIASSDSYAQDKGGSIGFTYKYNSSGGYATGARIYGAKENSTDGNWNGYIGFATAAGGSPVERARIDASGNLLVGGTSVINIGGSSLKLEAFSSGGGAIGAYQNSSGGYCFNSYAVSNGGTYYHMYFSDAGTSHGSITSNGTNTAYNTTSDISLKKNIQPASDALQSILSLKVRQFDWAQNDVHTDYGVVAQEADEYAPEIVTKLDLWQVDYGRITPRLIKAFQELAAKVSALEAKQ